jgi:hypothetical protein
MDNWRMVCHVSQDSHKVVCTALYGANEQRRQTVLNNFVP